MMQLTANLTPMIGKLVVAAVVRDSCLAAAPRSRRGEGIVTLRPSATWRATCGGKEKERQTTSLRLLLVTSVVGGVASLSFVLIFFFFSVVCVHSFSFLFSLFVLHTSSAPFSPSPPPPLLLLLLFFTLHILLQRSFFFFYPTTTSPISSFISFS